MKEHGVHPGKDVTLILSEVFGKYPEDTEFVFEPGGTTISHLRPSATTACPTPISSRSAGLGMLLKDMKNVRLTGNSRCFSATERSSR